MNMGSNKLTVHAETGNSTKEALAELLVSHTGLCPVSFLTCSSVSPKRGPSEKSGSSLSPAPGTPWVRDYYYSTLILPGLLFQSKA